MAMVGVVSGSLYMRTHSLSRLAWSWVGGRLAPFYIHQMNRENSRNGSAMMTAHKHCRGYYYYYYFSSSVSRIPRDFGKKIDTKEKIIIIIITSM